MPDLSNPSHSPGECAGEPPCSPGIVCALLGRGVAGLLEPPVCPVPSPPPPPLLEPGYYFSCAASAAVERRNAAVAAGLVAHPLSSVSPAPLPTPSGLRGTVLSSEFLGQLPSVVLTESSGFPATSVADPAGTQRLFLLNHYQQVEAKVGCVCVWGGDVSHPSPAPSHTPCSCPCCRCRCRCCRDHVESHCLWR